MWIRIDKFLDGFSGLSLAFEWWRDLLSIPKSSDSLIEYVDFWEELNSGWMQEYIWPYDDIFGVSKRPSEQRKLRLGRR